MLPRFLFYIMSATILLFSGCSTGIEKTKTISLSKNDKKELAPSQEEIFIEPLKAELLCDWSVGKSFLVSDERASVVFDAIGVQSNLEGKIVKYSGVEKKTTPDGTDEAVIIFSDGTESLRYSTGKRVEDAVGKISSMDIPMLIDLDLVDKAGKLLSGKTLWTRSQLWYDRLGNKISGRKFVPVTVEAVLPGNMIFPLRVNIRDENGDEAMLYMNLKNSGVESRTFSTLFNLKDQKLSYPSILPEVWSLIQDGKVKLGMTKEECKLSLGNPGDVNSGHDWNSTIDLWQYPNGAYLRFQDGLLVDFRN